LGDRDARLDAIVAELITYKLAVEQPGVAPEQAWRTVDDQRIGLVIAPAGLRAIGVEADGDGEVDAEIEADFASPLIKPTRASSKQQQVIDMLSREGGATLAEIVEATGWLKHTSSAVLTGLRKKGHAITRDKRGEETCYFLKVQS
jgi:hypothetical protein